MEVNKTLCRSSLGFLYILGLFEQRKKFICYSVCELFTLLLNAYKAMEYFHLDEISLKILGDVPWICGY